MIPSRQFFTNIQNEAARVGYLRAIERSLYFTANKFICLRSLEVIRLTREQLRPLDPAKYAGFTSRIANERELLELLAEGCWNMTEELIEGFRRDGDCCLLSFVGGKLAGYTWVHVAGRPEILPGLRISIPDGYGYNFAAFTAPEFRGVGLQAYRHHEVLSRPEWTELKGMIGYVESTNFSSQKGQAKSGYQRLGTMRLIGGRKRFDVLMSAELKALGIRRIHD